MTAPAPAARRPGRPERARPRPRRAARGRPPPGRRRPGPGRKARTTSGGDQGDDGADPQTGGQAVDEAGGRHLGDLAAGAPADLLADRERRAEPFAGLVDSGGREAEAAQALGELGGVDRRHQAADDGDAEGAADLAGGVVHGRADAGLLTGQRAHDRLGGRRHREAHADGHDDHAGQERRVAAVETVMKLRLSMPADTRTQAGGHDGLGAEALDEPGRQRGDDHHRQGVAGPCRTPASSGVKPSTNCRYWRDAGTSSRTWRRT